MSFPRGLSLFGRRLGPAVKTALGICTLAGALAGGQDPSPPAACTYDACALRYEWSGYVLRGESLREVGRFGLIAMPPMSRLVSGSDSAAAYAAVFERDYRAGRRFMWSGFAAMAAPLIVVTSQTARTGVVHPLPPWAYGSLALGFGLEAMAGRRMHSAERAFHRTIWFYNRDLAR